MGGIEPPPTVSKTAMIPFHYTLLFFCTPIVHYNRKAGFFKSPPTVIKSNACCTANINQSTAASVKSFYCVKPVANCSGVA